MMDNLSLADPASTEVFPWTSRGAGLSPSCLVVVQLEDSAWRNGHPTRSCIDMWTLGDTGVPTHRSLHTISLNGCCSQVRAGAVLRAANSPCAPHLHGFDGSKASPLCHAAKPCAGTHAQLVNNKTDTCRGEDPETFLVTQCTIVVTTPGETEQKRRIWLQEQKTN